MNPRSELISLLRGFFACPLISTLSELGITDVMIAPSFTLNDFPERYSRVILAAILRYMADVGLVRISYEDNLQRFELTALGSKVLVRDGAFNLLHSYEDYFRNLEALLLDTDKKDGIKVNRIRNVVGSGRLHSRKFFPAALDLMGSWHYGAVIDVGCGNGQFLVNALQQQTNMQAFAIDLSVEAVEVTTSKLKTQRPDAIVTGIVGNGADIEFWSRKVTRFKGTALISLWFVLHEFCARDVTVAIKFFTDIHSFFPTAHVLLGEIVEVPTTLLSSNRGQSIMPEYLLFHSLSGQGVFSWEQFREIRCHIPYLVEKEVKFDCLGLTNEEAIPSSFIWHLKPTQTQ